MTSMRTRVRTTLVLLSLAVALGAIVACGSDDETAGTSFDSANAASTTFVPGDPPGQPPTPPGAGPHGLKPNDEPPPPTDAGPKETGPADTGPGDAPAG